MTANDHFRDVTKMIGKHHFRNVTKKVCWLEIE